MQLRIEPEEEKFFPKNRQMHVWRIYIYAVIADAHAYSLALA